MSAAGIIAHCLGNRFGKWFFGPAAENGVLGGSNAFYLTSDDPTDWSASTPIALPAGLTALGRISVANGRVFFHSTQVGEMAQVSSDGGNTWTECDHQLWSASHENRDVYWNGSYYYWANVRSSDGVTWVAIPNFPVGITPASWYARTRDGLFLVGAAVDANIYTTLNDGTSAFTTRTTPFGGFAGGYYPFESDGNRIVGANTSGIGNGYSDDIFATAATHIPVNTGSTKRWYNNVWIGHSVELTRSTDGISWGTIQNIVNAGGPVGKHTLDVDTRNGVWGFIDCQVIGTSYLIYTSTDDGQTWVAGDTLYGNGNNLAFVRY